MVLKEGREILLMSSSSGIAARRSRSISGALGRGTLVDVLARTLGHAGAAAGAARRSRSSGTEVLLSVAAAVRLQRVMERPGPLREVSKAPE